MIARAVTLSLRGTWCSTYGVVACPVPGHGKGKGDRNPSLKLVDGESGELVLHCFAGCSWRDVRDELRQRGLIPDDGRRDGGDHQHRDPGRRHGCDRDPGADDQRRIAAARRIWQAAQSIANTAGERYFINRGISIEIPPSIRFAPALKHPDTGLYLPAVVMAVQNCEGQVAGVQRVYLKANGTGKALVSRPKMAKGVIAGGTVRLGPAGRELGLVEGAETALSVMELHPGLSVWAALSVSNLGNVVLPPEVVTVHLFLDGDKPGSPAAATAAKAALVHLNARRKVQIHRAPTGKDWNDVLVESAGTLETADA